MRCVQALLVYWWSSLIVVAAVVFGADYLARKQWEPFRNLSPHFFRWDGRHYGEILEDGYTYDPAKASNIAFFPGYPLLGRAVSTTGLGSQASLLIVAHTCLAACFVLLALYAGEHATSVLLAFAFWPVTFFLRMGYSESMFLALTLLAMLGIQRGASPIAVAVAVGAATATRSVGVALLLPLVIYTYRTSRWYVWPAVALVSVWGLLAFMAWQYAALDTPLAFVQTQDNYRFREIIPWSEKLWKLATLEPFFAHYDPESYGYWNMLKLDPNVLFSLRFANPLYVLAAVVLLVIGWRKRWLSVYELSLAAGLLLIPYVARGYEFAMASQARFTAVVFPIYLVLGRLSMPQPIATLVWVTCAFFMVLYAALFSAGFPYF